VAKTAFILNADWADWADNTEALKRQVDAGVRQAGIITVGMLFEVAPGSIVVTATGPADQVAELSRAVARGDVVVMLNGIGVSASSARSGSKNSTQAVAIGVGIGAAVLVLGVSLLLVHLHRRRSLNKAPATNVDPFIYRNPSYEPRPIQVVQKRSDKDPVPAAWS
jgi:hypothetical protein